MKLTIEKLNETYLRVYSEDAGVEYELESFFTYEFPGARFTPKFKARLWDGKVRLYDLLRKTIYCGLYRYILAFAERNGYEVELINTIENTTDITFEEVEQFAESLQLCNHQGPIDIHDYQIDAIHTALKRHRVVLVSPTGSGKSLIIYTIMRYLLNTGKKMLVVVPSTSLVEQLYADFCDYSKVNGWSASDNCQKLYSGFPKTFQSNVLISTWQSIYKQPKQWFQQFDCIIGDEAHQFKATSLTTIMGRLEQTDYRIGTTGSLDDKKLNRLTLEGIFGPVHKVTTTKQLMDTGRLSQLEITSLILKHDDQVRKEYNKCDYQTEINYIVRNEKRNKFIRNLALKTTGNTLILFQFTEKHGKVLFDLIADKAGNRSVYYIDKDVKATERERIRKQLANETDAIVVASYGTSATGINIPTIENIIFASPSKSIIRNLQSIGRGLRLAEGKTHCNLYDIGDDLHWKSWRNHTLKHAAERYKLYSQEQFSVKIVEVEI